MVVQETSNGLANTGPLMKALFAATPTETGGGISDGTYNSEPGEKVTIAAVGSAETIEITDFKNSNQFKFIELICNQKGLGFIIVTCKIKGRSSDTTTFVSTYFLFPSINSALKSRV